MARNLLTTEQVATRLGVKAQTVYAYVSRGLLTRTMAADGRTSRFDPAEVEELARRGRPRRERRQAGSVEVALATGITRLDESSVAYRGLDVAELAATTTFEGVAELLWSGRSPTHLDASRWQPAAADLELVAAVTGPLPDDAPVSERLAVAVAALACTDPLRVDRRPAGVARVGRRLLGVLPAVPVVPTAPTGRARSRRPGRASGHLATGARRPTAAALWPRLSPLAPTRPRVRVLDAALVLLADHELATSTLAARVAASTRADPYAVVLAGLGAAAGPRHGAAAAASHRLLLAADADGSADVAVARALADDGTLPGFGHAVYAGDDPRAAVLLDRLGAVCPRRAAEVVDRVLAAGRAAEVGGPNVDLALAALAYATQMPVGATEAVFTVARVAGWLAHAVEEYGEAPLRFRARALYTG